MSPGKKVAILCIGMIVIGAAAALGCFFIYWLMVLS